MSDFSFEPISPVTLLVGATGTAQVTVDSLFGFNSQVGLTVSGPATVNTTLSSGSVTPPAAGKGSSTLTLTLTPAVIPGTLQFTVKGSIGTLTHSVTFNVTVNADSSSLINVINQMAPINGVITPATGIDNSGIAGSLANDLSTAQAALNAGDTKTAKNALNALLNHISAQTGKHIMTSATVNGVTYSPAQVLTTEVNVMMLKLSGNADPLVGNVVNSLGQGIPGAVVSITDSYGNVVASAVTDVTGFYFVANTSAWVSGATYTATVTGMAGYNSSSPTQAPFTWQAVTTTINFMLN